MTKRIFEASFCGGVENSSFACVAKPFRVEELCLAVRRMPGDNLRAAGHKKKSKRRGTWELVEDTREEEIRQDEEREFGEVYGPN